MPASIAGLASLASLKLADNRLADGGLPWGALAALRGLTLLTLDRNALTALPAGLAGCSGLVRLSAAGNAIAAVEEGALAGLTSLAELDLSDNALGTLPDAIGAPRARVRARGAGQPAAHARASTTPRAGAAAARERAA